MPPLTLENAAALVPGGVTPAAVEKERKAMQAQAPAQQPKTLKVKVLRPFYYQGKPVEKNETVELPRVFALEMKAANKVELIKEVAVVAPASEKPKDADSRKGERK